MTVTWALLFVISSIVNIALTYLWSTNRADKKSAEYQRDRYRKAYDAQVHGRLAKTCGLHRVELWSDRSEVGYDEEANMG